MVDGLRLRLLAAEAQIRRMDALTQQAATARGNAFIRSPIKGIVGRCYLDQGDLAMPTLPICTVVQMEKVKLLLEVPEAELARVIEGMTALVRVARFPQKDFAGTVTRIFPTIDRRTRTAQVNVELDNLDHQLMPGMLARVRLEVESHDKVVVIPYSALIIEMGIQGKVVHRVYVVDAKNRAEERTVTLGIVDAKRVEVLSGLGPGDALVTQGQHLLEPGKAVDVVERLGLDGKVVVDKGQKK
jgi:membrane fusion protein (multidrug efflux system)